MTPKQIVIELDKYIVGQDDAKRAVAVALRNRYRRSMLKEEVRDDITPKNIILKGPTGVGKTEIARRLAKLVKAPFVKVEATKFTEVGYVGRDVESMIRDLAEVAVRLVKEEKFAEVETKAKQAAENKIVTALLKQKKDGKKELPEKLDRENILKAFREGKEDNTLVEVTVADNPKPLAMPMGGSMEIDMGALMSGFMGGGTKKHRTIPVKEAFDIFVQEESEKLIDKDAINAEGIKRAEQQGIIFIDEIDKIAAKNGGGAGPDVSREGVQRDILPIVEGSTVNTKYGAIRTDFILFIASGAFHIAKLGDLIPELQGRFPVRVELNSLKYEDFVNILTAPQNAITKQYTTLLEVDKVTLRFEKSAIEEISRIAVLENETSEDIGARRLHTIMENLLEDISFNASGDHPMIDVKIDKKYVIDHLSKAIKKHDLKKYIL